MKPKWSPHAKSLLADILHTITYELSEEDAARWNRRIQVLSIRHARMLVAEDDTDWS